MKKLIATGVLLLMQMATYAQCAMCRATVESNLSEGRGVIGTGLNFGILYLLVIPYLSVGALIFLWFKYGKKELKERLESEARLKEVFGK